MSLELQEIKNGLEKELEALRREKGAETANRIRPILYTNLDRGRIESFLELDLDLIPAYVQRVCNRYQSLSAWLHEVQVERSTSAWEPLFARMQTWAYTFLIRKGFLVDATTRETAEECATEAAVALLDAYFPYDTDFEPWAHVIVQNACRKFMQKAARKSVVPDDKLVEIDEMLDGLRDPSSDTRDQPGELGSELAEALLGLSEARRTVIRLLYFENLSPEEAADKMGKSKGAVYSLLFHALHDLRKILAPTGDNLNE